MENLLYALMVFTVVTILVPMGILFLVSMTIDVIEQFKRIKRN